MIKTRRSEQIIPNSESATNEYIIVNRLSALQELTDLTVIVFLSRKFHSQNHKRSLHYL